MESDYPSVDMDYGVDATEDELTVRLALDESEAEYLFDQLDDGHDLPADVRERVAHILNLPGLARHE